MTDPRPADSPLIGYTHIVYALHALSVLIGITGPATIVGSFVFGLPSIIAVVMNYVRRREVSGTWLGTHFTWQIQTFWRSLIAIVIAGVLSAPLVLALGLGILTFYLALVGIGIWVIYRVARGWLALREGRSMPVGDGAAPNRP